MQEEQVEQLQKLIKDKTAIVTDKMASSKTDIRGSEKKYSMPQDVTNKHSRERTDRTHYHKHDDSLRDK